MSCIDVSTGRDDVSTGCDDVSTGCDDVSTGCDDVSTGRDDVRDGCIDVSIPILVFVSVALTLTLDNNVCSELVTVHLPVQRFDDVTWSKGLVRTS